jgi:uncharacterized coiled-coil DUF342 family protein
MKNHTASEGLRKALDELKTFRDEIRVNLHLAGMDLRDEWQRLEKRIQSQTASAAASDTAEAAVHALKKEVDAFKHRLDAEKHTAAHH